MPNTTPSSVKEAPDALSIGGDHDSNLSPSQAQYENMQRMMKIVQHMKEIPELPSEKLDNSDSSILTRVEFPDEGGVLTYMEGQTEPYRGFPFFEMVDKVDILKKVIRGILSSFFHNLKRRSYLQLACVVFVPWLIMDSAKALIYVVYRTIERFRIKPQMYSRSMRELYRVLSLETPGESESDKDFRIHVRDSLCMILEMDNAYRFRFQDIIVELDKVSLRKNPGKELVRLFTIMQSREKEQTVKDTWTLAKRFIPFFLRFNRKLSKYLVHALSEIDLSLVALTKEDKNYCVPRKDYTFGFVLNPVEEDKEQIQKLLEEKEKKELRKAVRQESTKAHEELFARHKENFPITAELDQKIQSEVEMAIQNLQLKANKDVEEARTAILNKYLSSEQKEAFAKQREEIAKLDQYYTKKLAEIDL